jgi:16S rRNA processing protein RimM
VSAETDRLVWLGRIAGVYGVKGWIKLHSFTEPRSNLFDYPRWLLGTPEDCRPAEVEEAKVAGKHLIAKLAGVDDRDQAEALIGSGIAVRRAELPPCGPDEYYWADLEGLRVVSRAGEPLGRVARILATGANDVLVLDGDGTRMIPFVTGQVVTRVDIDGGEIEVDWDASYWES